MAVSLFYGGLQLSTADITRAAVLVTYFVIVIVMGFIARGRLKESPDGYFLAGRGLGTFVLIGTMAATNFSAFTVFGASGAGYRDGLAFFPIMAFGTGFMALTFWIIGRKVWALGKEHGLITPSELIGKLYNNRWLSGLFALVLVIFTIPYLALQPMAGGYVLDGLFGFGQTWGAAIVTAVILVYTLRGGMKAVAWTDVFQGILMVVLMIVALVMVVNYNGGLASASSQVIAEWPELFSRPGGTAKYTPAIWFSFMFLWFLCDPMFPQLFQRFYSAGNEHALARTMLWYPAICTVVFILPVALGVLGHLSFPGLEGKEADSIVPMLVTSIGGDFMGTLILAAGLAALMSTMDSQLLTLSSIFTRDILPFFRRSDTSNGSLSIGRIFVAGLAICGFLIAMNPPDTILDFAVKQAFTGLAVLFPTVLFGLYLKNPKPAAAICSILVGEALVVAYELPDLAQYLHTFGFLPVLTVIAASVITYAALQLAVGQVELPPIQPRQVGFAAGFGIIFVLAMDFWRWGEVGQVVLGLPVWAWYFVMLSVLQTILMLFWLRSEHVNKKAVSEVPDP